MTYLQMKFKGSSHYVPDSGQSINVLVALFFQMSVRLVPTDNKRTCEGSRPGITSHRALYTKYR